MKVIFSIVLLLFIIGLVYALFYIFENKIKIKWKTFTKKGFAPKRGDFGVYCYDGKQGKGKTYSLVEYLIDNKDSIVTLCNVADIRNINYFHFTGFAELIKLKNIIDSNETDTLKLCIDYFGSRGSVLAPFIDEYKNGKQLVFVYDEIFTELQKQSRLNKDIIDFLCQMRKRKIIFLTTAQEWAEIPLSFRRFCRYEIRCNMINFFGIGLLFKEFNDAEHMKWSDEEQEHIAPLLETTLTKCRKFIADSYNTYLRISSVEPQVSTYDNISIIDIDRKR